jgi:hypothetical protein
MCQSCEWEETLERLNDLCEDPDFEWANDTLSGIAETIEVRGHVTEKQLDAIENITAAVERRR